MTCEQFANYKIKHGQFASLLHVYKLTCFQL